eukprot:6210222-Amphidinium_carterae.2
MPHLCQEKALKWYIKWSILAALSYDAPKKYSPTAITVLSKKWLFGKDAPSSDPCTGQKHRRCRRAQWCHVQGVVFTWHPRNLHEEPSSSRQAATRHFENAKAYRNHDRTFQLLDSKRDFSMRNVAKAL